MVIVLSMKEQSLSGIVWYPDPNLLPVFFSWNSRHSLTCSMVPSIDGHPPSPGGVGNILMLVHPHDGPIVSLDIHLILNIFGQL